MSRLRIFLTSLLLGGMVCLPLASRADSAGDPWGNSRPMLYGTSRCPYCKAARVWFAQNNVAFGDCDIEKDTVCRGNYLQLRRELGVRGVPVFVYQGNVWTGYSPEQMAEIVASKGR
jgi:glutaredoxin